MAGQACARHHAMEGNLAQGTLLHASHKMSAAKMPVQVDFNAY